MRTSLLSSVFLLLPPLVGVGVGGCEADEPSTTRTGAYALEEVVVRVSTTVRTPTFGGALVTLSAQGGERFVGEGDELFLVQGGNRQDAISVPTSGFSFVPASVNGPLHATFVRDGREYAIPLWQGPLPKVTSPEEIVMGTTVEIDIAPRPAPGTKIWLALQSCIGRAGVELDTLPWKLDTATGIQKDAQSSEACCEGAAPHRRCSVRFESNYDSIVRPSEGGPFHRSSETRTIYYLHSDGFVRL